MTVWGVGCVGRVWCVWKLCVVGVCEAINRQECV